MEPKLLLETVETIRGITDLSDTDIVLMLARLEDIKIQNNGILTEQDFLDVIHQMIKDHCKA